MNLDFFIVSFELKFLFYIGSKFDNGNGKSISEIAKLMERKNGGIRARLRKMGLIDEMI